MRYRNSGKIFAMASEEEVVALVWILLILLHLRLILHLHHHLLLLHLHLHLLHRGWVGAPARLELVSTEGISTTRHWLETALRLETRLLLLLLVLFCGAKWVSPWHSLRLELVTKLLLHNWLLALILVCVKRTKYINFALRGAWSLWNTTTWRTRLTGTCAKNVI